MICAQCRREFNGRTSQRFCSEACYYDSIRVVDLWTLRKFVEAGIGKSRMAREFGVQRKTIRELITNHGLEALWRQRRYQKGGSLLAIGALGATTAQQQSARCS